MWSLIVPSSSGFTRDLFVRICLGGKIERLRKLYGEPFLQDQSLFWPLLIPSWVKDSHLSVPVSRLLNPVQNSDSGSLCLSNRISVPRVEFGLVSHPELDEEHIYIPYTWDLLMRISIFLTWRTVCYHLGKVRAFCRFWCVKRTLFRRWACFWKEKSKQ